MIFGTSERAGDAWRTAIDRSERSGANVEFRELIKLDVDLVLWGPLALRLDLLGL